eukprot:jgi/Orpsp1_1/1190950/evm.model.d7180000082386.1
MNHTENLKISCIYELDKYDKCLIDNDARFRETTLDYLLGECNNINFNECFNFFNNITEILNEYPSCSSYKELNAIEDIRDNLKIYLYEYYVNILNNIYCRDAYKCEQELKEYEECKIDVTMDMEEKEILKR